jgi:two-component system cell cycle sensor histidine kinase/response regulator CckA
VPHLTDEVRPDPWLFVKGESVAPEHVVLGVAGTIFVVGVLIQVLFDGIQEVDVAFAVATTIVGLGMGPRWGALGAMVATGLTFTLPAAVGSEGHVVQILGYFALGTLGGTVAERLRGARDSRMRHLAEVVHQTDAAILSLSLPGGVITSWNPRCEQLLGWSADEVLGRDSSFLVGNGLQAEARDDAKALMSGERILRETRWVNRGGGEIDLSVTAAPLTADGKTVGASLVAIDISTQAAAVHALRQEEARFRSAFAHAPAGMAVVSHEESSFGRLLKVNPALSEITGFSEETLLTTGFERFLEEAKSTGALGQNREVRFVRADGRLIWIQLSSSPVFDEHGVPTHSIAQVQDITARKVAETVRSRLAAIVADSTDAIVAKDLAGVITSWNAAAAALYGYTREEAIGLHSSELVPEELRAGEHERFVTVLGGQSIAERETQRLTRDGQRIAVCVTISPIRDEDGAIVGASSIARDMTQERIDVAALRASEERLRLIFETAGEGIQLIDLEGVITFANEKMGSMIGTTPEEMVGHSYKELMSGDHNDLALAGSVLESRQSGVSDLHEYPYVRPDGSDGWVLVSGSPMYDSDGEIVGSLAMVTEITDRVLAQQERTAMESVLHQSQRLESLGELAGGVAHDMNNLLAVITNFADFALDEVGDGAGSAQLKEIRHASGSAAGLIRQLLLFARQEITEPEILELNAVLEEHSDILSRLAGPSVELSTDYGDALPRVNVDPGMLEQVAMNLVVNARDAMPDGGPITIATAKIAIDAGEVPDVDAGDYVFLSVTDTGTGMTPEVAARAFDPFFSTKPRGSGTGLGLATVYGVAKQFGGHVAIDSEPGAGACVTVYFPAVPADQPSAQPLVAPAPGAAAADGTILLVEDNDGVRRVASHILRAGGYTVIEAASPSGALKLACERDAPLDLLLTDVVMPEMSGPVLAAQLQAGQPGLPVVFASGFTDRAAALPAGTHFVSKPFDGPELLAAVAAAWESP